MVEATFQVFTHTQGGEVRDGALLVAWLYPNLRTVARTRASAEILFEELNRMHGVAVQVVVQSGARGN